MNYFRVISEALGGFMYLSCSEGCDRDAEKLKGKNLSACKIYTGLLLCY